MTPRRTPPPPPPAVPSVPRNAVGIFFALVGVGWLAWHRYRGPLATEDFWMGVGLALFGAWFIDAPAVIGFMNEVTSRAPAFSLRGLGAASARALTDRRGAERRLEDKVEAATLDAIAGAPPKPRCRTASAASDSMRIDVKEMKEQIAAISAALAAERAQAPRPPDPETP